MSGREREGGREREREGGRDREGEGRSGRGREKRKRRGKEKEGEGGRVVNREESSTVLVHDALYRAVIGKAVHFSPHIHNGNLDKAYMKWLIKNHSRVPTKGPNTIIVMERDLPIVWMVLCKITCVKQTDLH